MKALFEDLAADPAFCVCALVAIAGALTVVTRRNPVYSALGLMAAFVSFAVIFVKLSATFLAAIHVLVYTGAILVLFLFVIMLLNLQEKELGREPRRVAKTVAALLALALFGLIGFAVFSEKPLHEPVPGILDARLESKGDVPAMSVSAQADPAGDTADWGGVRHVGMAIFTKWAFPFELVSALIIVAILGAVVLAKKKLPPGP